MSGQTLGQMIASLRKERGMTQLELAERMGVTDKAVSKWERDLSCPSVETLPKLAELFCVSVDELMQVQSQTPPEAGCTERGEITVLALRAVALAVASLSLQKRQAENELQEKKSNILQSLGYSPDENPQEFDRALADFDNQVKSFVLDADGVKTETPSKEVFAMLATNQNIRDNYDAKRLILFQTEDGRVVIPLIGMGLWGDIWGYVALEKDMDTVSGIVMAHKGETPGLGAEIATPKFQAHFAGKKLFKSGEFVSVSLRKGGAKDPEHEVDGISGGTKTSDGVTAMLRDCLSAYLPYFESQHQAAAQSAPAAANEAASSEVSNQQNVNESHE